MKFEFFFFFRFCLKIITEKYFYYNTIKFIFIYSSNFVLCDRKSSITCKIIKKKENYIINNAL